MRRSSTIRPAILLAFWGSAAAAAHAQQQYGDPSGFPGTYLTQRTSPAQAAGVPRIDVTYFVDGTFTNAEHAVINQAAAVWSGTYASVNLVEVGSAAAAAIDFTTTNLVPNTPALATRSITSTAGAGTYPDGITPWRHITNAAITIDSNPQGPYFIGALPVPSNRFDYFSLVLREFGLGLGLGFATGDPNSVMDATLAQGEQHRSLSSLDIAALNTLYGTPEPATWALFAVGLLVLGVGRKFIF